MKIPVYIITTIIILLSVHSCVPVKESYDPNDLSYIYNPLKSSMHPSFRVFNESDDFSQLSIRFFASDLFFSEANAEGVPKTAMVAIYRLYNLSMGRVPVDTAMYNLSIRQETGRRDYIFNISMEAPAGSLYEVEVVIKDIIKNTRIQHYITFDKRDRLNRFNFKMVGLFDRKEVYTPVLREHEFVNLLYPNGIIDSLFIRYYKPFDEIPEPPYLLIPERELDLEPEMKAAIPYSDTLPIMCRREGVYQFVIDSNDIRGYTIFNFGADFPSMRSPATMIEPLIYLADRPTLDAMTDSPRPKVALDEFWISLTGNVERSRELIRIYYNRVLYSNLYFTSYKEGWKTDRGMIYIIYGPPDKVYKTTEGERWGYNRPQIKSGWGIRYKVEDDLLFFSFRKKENPFSENNYTLIRNESLTTFWEQAVRSWRKGVVFRLDNPGDI